MRWRAMTALVGWVMCSLGAPAGADSPLRVKTGPPPGFDDLSAPQTTEADVFYGGKLITTAFVEFDLTSVTLRDPLAVTEAIPNARDPAYLAGFLSGRLANNAQVLCSSRRRDNCGRLEPEVIDVVFDESRFRLELFIASRELLTHHLAQQRYLPASQATRASLNHFRINLGGVGDQRRFNVGAESFVAQKASRLRARYGISDEQPTLYELAWQHDGRDVAYEVGSFRAVGGQMGFAAETDVLGFRVGTSTKTRVDLRHALSTPLYLFLAERSRVDVYRGSELLSSRYYDAGNQQLDTGQYPDGAYDLTLRILDASGRVTTQTQFFVRSGQLPPRHEPQFYVEMGQVVDTQRSALPEPQDAAWVRAGASVRIADSAALDHELVYAGRKGLAQVGAFWLKPRWHAYAGAMYSNEGDLGLSLRGSWRWRETTANLDVRYVDAARGAVPVDEFDLVREGFTQASATLATPLGAGRLILRGRLNDRSSGRERGVGVSFWAPALRRGRLAGDWNLDAYHTSDDAWLRLGFTLRWRDGRDSAFVRPQTQLSRADGAWGTEAMLDGRWNLRRALPGFGAVDQTYYATHDGDRSALGVRFVPDEYPQSDFELGLQRRDRRNELFYTLNNSFSVVTKDGSTSVSSGSGQESGGAAAVVVLITGNTFGKFDVVVNDRVAGSAWAHQRNILSLRPYETYEIRVRPNGDGIVGVDDAVHTVTLYPGNVHTLHFAAKELTVLVGQALHPDGTVVKHAKFQNVEGFGATDASGWFQVEVVDLAPLELTLPDGSACELTVPPVYVEDGLAVLDALTCQPVP